MIRFRWRTCLKQATNEEEVLALVGRYLDEWTAAERAALPANAWPPAIHAARDVTAWTFRLGELHTNYQGDAAGLKSLQELWLFFTHAAVRLTQLRSAVRPGASKSLES